MFQLNSARFLKAETRSRAPGGGGSVGTTNSAGDSRHELGDAAVVQVLDLVGVLDGASNMTAIAARRREDVK